jgi:hypothetical protein
LCLNRVGVVKNINEDDKTTYIDLAITPVEIISTIKSINAQLTIHVSQLYSIGIEGFKLNNKYGVVKLSFFNDLYYEDILENARWLASLIYMSFNKKTYVTEYQFQKNNDWLYYLINHDIERKSKELDSLSILDQLIPYHAIQNEFDSIINYWFENQSKLHYPVYLWLSLIDKEMPLNYLESKFLNSLFAIEGLYKAFNIKSRKTLSQILQFTVQEILDQELPKNDATNVMDIVKLFVKFVKNCRNDLVHGSKLDISYTDLHEATSIMQGILINRILVVLNLVKYKNTRYTTFISTQGNRLTFIEHLEYWHRKYTTNLSNDL